MSTASQFFGWHLPVMMIIMMMKVMMMMIIIGLLVQKSECRQPPCSLGDIGRTFLSPLPRHCFQTTSSSLGGWMMMVMLVTMIMKMVVVKILMMINTMMVMTSLMPAWLVPTTCQPHSKWEFLALSQTLWSKLKQAINEVADNWIPLIQPAS